MSCCSLRVLQLIHIDAVQPTLELHESLEQFNCIAAWPSLQSSKHKHKHKHKKEEAFEVAQGLWFRKEKKKASEVFFSRSTSRTSTLHSLQFCPFPSSLASIVKTSNQHSFAVSYRTRNTSGCPPEDASEYVNCKTPNNPDSVIVFLENHEFSKTQISKLIEKLPRNRLSDLQKSVLPLIEFLKSEGASSTDVAEILSTTPSLLKRSLENDIIPSFDLLKNLIESEEKEVTLTIIKRIIERSDGTLFYDLQSDFVPNIEFLLQVGVPKAKMLYLLRQHPNVFRMAKDKLRGIVEEVEDMGFDPLELKFMMAVYVLWTMQKSTWDKKVEVYKKWGWSDDEILVAFRKFPRCMSLSAGKIMAGMDFFVNKLGFESSYLIERSELLSASLQKTIVPRSAVYQALVSKGLTKDGDTRCFHSMLKYSERKFLSKFVYSYVEEAPELLELYKAKLALAK